MIRSFAILAFALCFACTQVPSEEISVENIEGEVCQTGVFRVDADFAAANMASCAVVDATSIEI